MARPRIEGKFFVTEEDFLITDWKKQSGDRQFENNDPPSRRAPSNSRGYPGFSQASKHSCEASQELFEDGPYSWSYFFSCDETSKCSRSHLDALAPPTILSFPSGPPAGLFPLVALD